MTARCPFAIWDPIASHNGAGAMTGGPWKIVHHTTEGDTYAGARGAYAATGNLPTFTDSFEGGIYRVRQHLPLNVAATALVHPPGKPETNKANVIQIEHVGHAATSAAWPAAYLDGIAALCRWIEQTVGVPRSAPFAFGPGAPRLSWPQWQSFGGHFGHVHVPGNDHTDPGPIDIAHILNAGQPAPIPVPAPPPITYVDEETSETMNRELFDCGVLDGQGNAQIIWGGGRTGERGLADLSPAIPYDKFRNAWVHGGFAPADGHPPAPGWPTWAPQQRDGVLTIEFTGGVPGMKLDVEVTWAA